MVHLGLAAPGAASTGLRTLRVIGAAFSFGATGPNPEKYFLAFAITGFAYKEKQTRYLPLSETSMNARQARHLREAMGVIIFDSADTGL
jgi:hypothetical protein